MERFERSEQYKREDRRVIWPQYKEERDLYLVTRSQKKGKVILTFEANDHMCMVHAPLVELHRPPK